MIDIKLVRDDPEGVKRRLATRGIDTGVIDDLATVEATYRHRKSELESFWKSEFNKVNKVFGQWYGASKKGVKEPVPAQVSHFLAFLELWDAEEKHAASKGALVSPHLVEASIPLNNPVPKAYRDNPDAIRDRLRQVSQRIATEEAAIREGEDRDITAILLHIPNLPSPHTPLGKSEADNKVVREWGKKPEFAFSPKAHWDLVKDRGLELEIGGRISGSGFPFLRGPLAKLERALINFFIELHTAEHGYTECWTPFMVRAETLRNSSQLPKFEEDLYRADERDDLYLIPTAEVPLTSVHAGEVTPDEKAPIRYCAFTPCFRREAGAAGKDTRGILRVHQFSKVELMVVTTPERSEEEHETLTRCAETVLERLNIPHRRLELCTADIGFGAARCYDLEAWAAGVGKWLEVSSCSSFTDFQARRAKIRVKDKDKNTRLAHTLNGSGLACPRTMIAILENNQRQDGTIGIPKALQPYYGAEVL